MLCSGKLLSKIVACAKLKKNFMSNKFVALWENKLLVACVGCIGKLITRKRQDQNNTGCFASKNEKE